MGAASSRRESAPRRKVTIAAAASHQSLAGGRAAARGPFPERRRGTGPKAGHAPTPDLFSPSESKRGPLILLHVLMPLFRRSLLFRDKCCVYFLRVWWRLSVGPIP